RILYEIACGLETVHTAGVIHRDIKGANILITETNHAAIADFGLSKNILSRPSSSASRLLQSVGTLNWMSPEQRLSPSKITNKSDIWSFGMVMWELVAGHMPFQNMSDEEIVAAIQSEHTRPDMPHGCHHKLWKLIQSCWTLAPGERPSAANI
ncbi:kinase-like domain-containing protein, partial [Obelidium mucronatum]